jgi:hypothetical protein
MTKKEQPIKVITTPLHKDFSTFSRDMVDYPHVAIKEVSTNKLVGGKVVRGKPLEKIVHATGKHKYVNHKISLLVVKEELEGTIVTTTNSDIVHLSNQRTCLSDEALLYLVHLSGHPKNMFLFIVFYLINTETLEFKTDSSIKYKYVEFCKATGCQPPVIVTINDAIKRLSEIGLILNVKKNLYMINPIVLGYSYDLNRSKAIRIYSQKLFDKGKDVAEWLLPNIGLLK